MKYSEEDYTFLRTKLLEVVDIYDPFQGIELSKQHFSDPSVSTPEVLEKRFIAVCVYNNTPSPIFDLIKILQLSNKCNRELEKLITEKFYDNNFNESTPQNILNKSGNDYDDIENMSIDSEDSLKSDSSYDRYFKIEEAKEVSESKLNSREDFVFGTDCPCKLIPGKQPYEHWLTCKYFCENKSAEM